MICHNPADLAHEGFADTGERVTGGAYDVLHPARQLARRRGLTAQSVQAFRLAEGTWGLFIRPDATAAGPTEQALLPA